MNDEVFLADDGLILPGGGRWAEEKHRKIGYYAFLFSVSLKQKSHCRVPTYEYRQCCRLSDGDIDSSRIPSHLQNRCYRSGKITASLRHQPKNRNLVSLIIC